MADLQDDSEFSGSQESEEDESSEDEQEERPLKEARKDAVYNTVGLHEKLEEMGWPEDVEWVHSLAITYPDTGVAVDVDDDLSREMAFYTQALEGARDAYQKLQALNIPFLRPTDYYAEMVKTDTHMLKIKDKLLTEKTKMEEMEERRKSRDAKKFSKEVQAEKVKERLKRKKDDIESVKKWRKVRQKSGFTEGADAPPIDFDTKSRVRDAGGLHRRQPSSKNRQFRDSKYGNGGRKSEKRNNAESFADDSTFPGSVKGNNDRGSKGKGSFRGRSNSRGRGTSSRGRGSSRGTSRGRGRGRG